MIRKYCEIILSANSKLHGLTIQRHELLIEISYAVVGIIHLGSLEISIKILNVCHFSIVLNPSTFLCKIHSKLKLAQVLIMLVILSLINFDENLFFAFFRQE
jgi:hypothetical protein